MNRKISIVSIASLIAASFVGLSLPANASPGDSSCDLSSGDGLVDTPYLLSTEQDLFEMADCIDGDTSNNFFKL